MSLVVVFVDSLNRFALIIDCFAVGIGWSYSIVEKFNPSWMAHWSLSIGVLILTAERPFVCLACCPFT